MSGEPKYKSRELNPGPHPCEGRVITNQTTPAGRQQKYAQPQSNLQHSVNTTKNTPTQQYIPSLSISHIVHSQKNILFIILIIILRYFQYTSSYYHIQILLKVITYTITNKIQYTITTNILSYSVTLIEHKFAQTYNYTSLQNNKFYY